MEKSNEWIKIENNIATVGVSSYVIEEIGEIKNIHLPQVGQKIKKNEAVVVLESMKSAFDIYSPVDGEIIEINENLQKGFLKDLNESPETKGWLFKVKL